MRNVFGCFGVLLLGVFVVAWLKVPGFLLFLVFLACWSVAAHAGTRSEQAAQRRHRLASTAQRVRIVRRQRDIAATEQALGCTTWQGSDQAAHDLYHYLIGANR